MKQIRIIILLILLATPNLNAQYSIGINAGVTRMKFTGDPPEGIGYFSPQLGYSSSLQFNYRFNNGLALSIQPGYDIFKSKYSVLNDSATKVVDSTYFTMQSFSLPLHAVVWSENGRFYVLAGLEFSYILNFKGEVLASPLQTSNPDYEVSEFNFYAQFGAGFIIPLGRPYLSFELRYSQGLNDLIEGIDLRGLKGELTFVDLGFAFQ